MTKVLSIATIKFLDNGALEVKLSGCDGVTARKIDVIGVKLFDELNRVRAVERRKHSAQEFGKEPESKPINGQPLTPDLSKTEKANAD